MSSDASSSQASTTSGAKLALTSRAQMDTSRYCLLPVSSLTHTDAEDIDLSWSAALKCQGHGCRSFNNRLRVELSLTLLMS